MVLVLAPIIGQFSPSITLAIRVGISQFGFILYCLLARCYKRRVRDEDYNAHRVVDEIYDRFVRALTNFSYMLYIRLSFC